MKILVIGGMHGNEPLGIELVQRLRQSPINNIDTALANEPAIKAKTRFTNTDLNRSFPGQPQSSLYEQWRANQLLKLCAAYDFVLDFHNTHCPNNDCTFIGEEADSKLYDLSAWLDLPRVIVADYDCINKYAPNCLSVEISLDSKAMAVSLWQARLKKLATLTSLPKAQSLETYRFVYRMTLEDKRKLNLESQKLRAFEPISKQLATNMNVASPAYPIFVDDAYTPYNFGGLLNRINEQ